MLTNRIVQRSFIRTSTYRHCLGPRPRPRPVVESEEGEQEKHQGEPPIRDLPQVEVQVVGEPDEPVGEKQFRNALPRHVMPHSVQYPVLIELSNKDPVRECVQFRRAVWSVVQSSRWTVSCGRVCVPKTGDCCDCKILIGKQTFFNRCFIRFSSSRRDFRYLLS